MERFSYPLRSFIFWLKVLLCNEKLEMVISQGKKNDNIVGWSTFIVMYWEWILVCLDNTFLFKKRQVKNLLQLFYDIFNIIKRVHVCIVSKILYCCICSSLFWAFTHISLELWNITVTYTFISKMMSSVLST